MRMLFRENKNSTGVNIPRVQGKQIPLKVGITALHRPHMSRDFFNHVRHRGGGIGEQVSVAWLLKTLGREIYLKTA
jgi:hypothetical protein